MAVATGIFNHAVTAGQALTGVSAAPMDSSTTGTNGTDNSDDGSGGSATISANDFLTLLVTEMQNQDPTADTDPNEYIDQLVQVNSLEQLIGINQTLTTALGSTTPSSGTGASTQAAGTTSGLTGTNSLPATAARTAGTPGTLPAAQTTSGGRAPGNLGVPRLNAAAQQVGHALDGRTHSRPAKGSAIPLQ